MYNAKIKIIHKDERKMVLRVYPESIKLKYKAGQYGALGLSKAVWRVDKEQKNNDDPSDLVKRAYSISCPILDEEDNLVEPEKLDYYEFYIDLVLADEAQKPRLSPRLFSLKNEDPIFLGNKIVGHYTLEACEAGKNILFISTTTGESPHNSMVTELLREKHPGKICNIVTGQEGWQSAYAPKHYKLMKKFPQYNYVTIQAYEKYNEIERELEDLLKDPIFSKQYLGWGLSPDNTHVFLCGDPAMIGAPRKLGGWNYEYPEYGLMRLLEKYHFKPVTRFQPGNISWETYW